MNPQAATPFPTQREGAREYLFEMIEQLAALARRTGDVEIAILLKAVLDSARVADRKRAG